MKILRYGSIVAVALLAAAIGFMSCSRGGKLASIVVTPASPTIATGTRQQFNAMAIFSNGTTLDWTTAATWSSSDAAVTMGNSLGFYGLATATSLVSGTTNTITITATDTANNISGAATLYITDPQSITITPANPYMATGATHQFTATAVLPDLSTGGTTTLTQDLTTFATWTTSSAGVATVSDTAGSKGLLISVATGTTDITAAIMTSLSTTVSGSTTLTVTNSTLASPIAITPNPAGPINVGLTLSFTATGNYSNGTTQNFTRSVTWSSSNTGVATISNTAGSNGVATAVSTGIATITATDPITGIAGSATLTVP